MVCRQRRDNRGSAIVIVIIAMAMIGILATTLLWMAYMNYMIKVADVRNKNSFYSAEEVVEQIMAGLQHTTADAVGVAYRDVMANWESLGTEDNRYNTFATTYMDTLIEELKSPTEGSGFYNRDKLKAYVDAGIFQESTDTKGVNKTAWNNGGPVGEGLKRPEMEMVNNNSIILHNIYVSYTDDQNRVSIVQTDICIDVPKLIFENSGSIDGLYEYSLIGNSGIEVSGPGGTTTVEGSIFAGMDAVTGDGGLLINPANSLALDNARRVIAKGDIVVKGPASALVVRDMPGEDNRVYAQNITLESGTVSLDCKTYVANDLSLNGSGSKATLTKEYYGYGTSTYNAREGEPQVDGKWQVDSSASSAIIINGKNSTVDMVGVNRLLLAGRSYIGRAPTMAEAESYRQEIEAGTREPSVPVMMGESIAVKGGQIAYLVPAECIGTVDGETVIGQNPIDGETYNMIRGNGSGAGDGAASEGENNSGDAGDADASGGEAGVFQEVNFDKPVYRLGGKRLRDFGVTEMGHIRRVAVPYGGGTLIYYYLAMKKEDAERYFVQYYNFNANKESIDRYFNTYASGGILLGDLEAPDTQYTILGNSLVSRAASASGVGLLTRQTTLNPDEGEEGTPGEGEGTEKLPSDPDAYTEIGENAEEMPNEKEKEEAEADVLQLSADIANIYRALTFNLTEDASTVPSDPEAAKDYYVFNSVIKEKEVEKYLDNNHKNTVTYTTDSGLKAILTREPLSVSNIDDKTRLIVSYGDVNVDKNFTGLIIAKGKITINPSAAVSIKQNKMDLYKVLEAKSEIPDDKKIPINMFVNGTGSMVDDAGTPGTGGMGNGTEAPTVDDAGNLLIDYGEIVRYMNWIKK